jgi:prephenate dehydrogenase
VIESLSEAQVTVVGLGLMGGSLAAALRRRDACRKVVGVTRGPSKIPLARRLGFVDEATTDLAEGLASADIVVLATPVTDIVAKVLSLGSLMQPGALLTDVGSTKRAICEAMESLPRHVQAIGGHPMCGKESSGLAVADPALYEGKRYVLCPISRTRSEALALGRELVEAVGAKPMVLEADRHDWAVAIASHLPYGMAVALVLAAEDLAGGESLPWELAASGFRDTSRVAASDVRMMLDILATNRDEVLVALRAGESALRRLRDLLQDCDLAALADALSAAGDRRTRIYP